MPSQYRTEPEVAQLLFNSLHNPDSTCQFCALTIQNKENTCQQGEGGLQQSLANMTAKGPSRPPKPEASHKGATTPVVSIAIKAYSMTTPETKAPDKKSGAIKQVAHPVLL